MQTVVNNLLTNYKLTGSGPLVLLVHGWGSDLNSFNNLQEDLSKKYQTLSIDLPGMGGTTQAEDNWNLREFADFVNSVLKKLKLNKPYAIIGHSNGGAIAIKMVADKLISPEKLVLLASSGVRSTRGTRKKTLATLAKAGKKSVSFLPKSSQDKIKKRLYSSIGSEGLLIPELEQTFRNIVNEDVQSIAKLISTPTLLIYGESDSSTPPEYGRVLSDAIPEAKLELIGRAGHFVHIDQSERVNKLIKKFLL